MRSIALLLFLLCFAVTANDTSLPFWAEKTSYLEGNRLYAVGVSKPQTELAKARLEAFHVGKIELMNHLQLSDLSQLEIKTERSVELPQAKGKSPQYVVYRLLSVDASQARTFKRRQVERAKKALLDYTNQLQALASELDPAIEESEKALEGLSKLEEKASEVDGLYRKRRERIKKTAEAIRRRISSRSNLLCEISRGMTKKEVIALVGKPDVRDGQYWHYAKNKLSFSSGGVVTRTILNTRCRD